MIDASLFSWSAFTNELPQGLLESIEADPQSLLAEECRKYIIHQIIPLHRRMSMIITAHAVVIELPPRE